MPGSADYKVAGLPLLRFGGMDWNMMWLFGKADAEQRVAWGTASYNCNEDMCPDCPANRSDFPFTDLLPDARWRPRRFNLQEYVAHMRQPLHPLAGAKFFSRHFIRHELMHTVDCNGVIATAGGSVLYKLTHMGTLGNNMQERLDFLNADYQQHCTDNKVSCRLPKLKLSHLTVDGKVCLHGPSIKAANSRAAVPWFLQLCRTHFNSGSQHDVSCTKALESLDRIIHTFYDSDLFLTAEAKADVESHGLRFGRHVMWLASNACRVMGVRTWHITPKFHFFMHIVSYDMHLINPRYVQAYLEEGLVGKIAALYAGSCAGPQNCEHMQWVAYLKYVVGLTLRLKGFAD